MRRLPLLLTLILGCAIQRATPPAPASPPPLIVRPISEVLFNDCLPCYTSKHGIVVVVMPDGECPPQAEFDAAITEVFKDAKIRRSRMTVLKGTSVVFVPAVVEFLGDPIVGLTLGDWLVIVTTNVEHIPWRGTLKHEVLHALKWHYGRKPDADHEDPRYLLYDSEHLFRD